MAEKGEFLVELAIDTNEDQECIAILTLMETNLKMHERPSMPYTRALVNYST